MSGLSPKLPVALDEKNGFKLTETYKEMVLQNLKNLVLTIPGEKMMDPEFGVGIKKYLFQQNSYGTYSEIEGRIENQAKKYMPFITIENIIFTGPGFLSDKEVLFETSAGMADYFVAIQIKFKIIPLGLAASLKLPE